MTTAFIYIVFAIIIIFDIIAVIIQGKKQAQKVGLKTITRIFRHWYSSAHIVPYMAGGLFLGHFYLYKFNKIFEIKTSIVFFIILSSVYLAWFIFETLRKNKSKIHLLFNKIAFFPFIIGAAIGSFWR